jgi:hypothetical protein
MSTQFQGFGVAPTGSLVIAADRRSRVLRRAVEFLDAKSRVLRSIHESVGLEVSRLAQKCRIRQMGSLVNCAGLANF